MAFAKERAHWVGVKASHLKPPAIPFKGGVFVKALSRGVAELSPVVILYRDAGFDDIVKIVPGLEGNACGSADLGEAVTGKTASA